MIGQVSSNDDRDFPLFKLLHGDLEWIRLAVQLDHNRSAHCDLQSPRSQYSRAFVSRSAGPETLNTVSSEPDKGKLIDLLGHIFGCDPLVLRNTSTALSRGDDLEAVCFLVRIYLVDVVVVDIVFEVVSANTIRHNILLFHSIYKEKTPSLFARIVPLL